jgi:hypothetical protein
VICAGLQHRTSDFYPILLQFIPRFRLQLRLRYFLYQLVLHRLLNLCELIGPMAIRPSVVHTCVQSHPLSNYLTKCDEIYMTFYQLSCSNGFDCNRRYENPKHRFWKKQCLKTLLISSQKHSNQIIIMASFRMLLRWSYDYFVIIKSKVDFFHFRHPV